MDDDGLGRQETIGADGRGGGQQDRGAGRTRGGEARERDEWDARARLDDECSAPGVRT